MVEDGWMDGISRPSGSVSVQGYKFGSFLAYYAQKVEKPALNGLHFVGPFISRVNLVHVLTESQLINPLFMKLVTMVRRLCALLKQFYSGCSVIEA